jgi:hypothetical protein
VVLDQAVLWGLEARQAIQVVALLAVELQGPPEGGHDLGRRVAGTALLQTDQVVDQDPGQRRQLLTPEASGAPGDAARQTDRSRDQTVPPRPKRRPKTCLAGGHGPSVVDEHPVPGLSGWYCRSHRRPVPGSRAPGGEGWPT